MDSSPAQDIPTPGRTAGAGEFAWAVAILALAGLGIALLALAAMPHRNEAGDSRPVANQQSLPLTTSFTLANLDARLYIVVVGEDEATALRLLLESEAQLRQRLGERQRDAEVLIATTEAEANAIAESINGEQSIPGLPPVQAVALNSSAIH